MLKPKEKTFIIIMTIIVLSMVAITIVIDLEFYIVLSHVMTTLALFTLIFFTLSKTMIKREGYFKDLESLFKAGKGEMIIFDGSPLAKLLSITNERIHYSQYKSMDEMRQMLKFMAISMIVSPILSFFSYALISYYKSNSFSFIQIVFLIIKLTKK